MNYYMLSSNIWNHDENNILIEVLDLFFINLDKKISSDECKEICIVFYSYLGTLKLFENNYFWIKKRLFCKK